MSTREEIDAVAARHGHGDAQGIDIVEQLRQAAHELEIGDSDFADDARLMREAADVIEALRSLGKQTVGPSFADVTKGLRHDAPTD